MKPPPSDQHEQAVAESVPVSRWQFNILDMMLMTLFAAISLGMYAASHPNAAALGGIGEAMPNWLRVAWFIIVGFMAIPAFAAVVSAYCINESNPPRLLFLFPAAVFAGATLLFSMLLSGDPTFFALAPCLLPIMLGGAITGFVDVLTNRKGRMAVAMCSAALLGVFLTYGFLVVVEAMS